MDQEFIKLLYVVVDYIEAVRLHGHKADGVKEEECPEAAGERRQEVVYLLWGPFVMA